jgi:quaternary ammonium compound-resistance protein SugE
VVTVTAMIASVWFLALAVCTIPMGTGYAVWTGIGAVGVAILGMVLFDERAPCCASFRSSSSSPASPG